jgi:hypothetical protein
LSKLILKQQEKESASTSSRNDNFENAHPVLCREWKERKCTYGSALCRSLMEVYEGALNTEERVSVLNIAVALVCLSPSAKLYAIENEFVSVLIDKLRGFGLKYMDSAETTAVGKKVI